VRFVEFAIVGSNTARDMDSCAYVVLTWAGRVVIQWDSCSSVSATHSELFLVGTSRGHMPLNVTPKWKYIVFKNWKLTVMRWSIRRRWTLSQTLREDSTPQSLEALSGSSPFARRVARVSLYTFLVCIYSLYYFTLVFSYPFRVIL
jgi:hypothetical protein